MNKKRTALVTGASRGLGAAMASGLAAAGHHVAINYFNSQPAAEALRQRIVQDGGSAATFKADVRDEQEIALMVDAIEQAFGSIDILVLNATGPQPMLPIEEQTWQSCLDQLEFFVKSPLLLLQRVLPKMKAQRFGRVINIGSEVVELGNPRFANYVSAKSAQLGLTRSWARELGPEGITVNLVAPGWIPVERHSTASQQELDQYKSGVPLGYMGAPEDVAKMVVYLASEGAGFVTGQKFAVNGGNTLG